MLTETKAPKRATDPQGFVDLKIAVPPELNSMLDQIVLATGISKSSLVRDALTRYGEDLGFLPSGSADLVTATRTRGPGPASNRKEQQ
jgi:hypothetical protein